MISIFCVILAGICNAIMDTIQFKFDGSIFKKHPKLEKWANPRLSWRNKWKNGDPDQGEKFPGSSTIFVWFTDLWHFSQSWMISFFCFAVVFYNPIFQYTGGNFDILVDLIILKSAFSLSFEIFWSKVLKS